MAAILFLKKTLENIFFQSLRGQKSKIGGFCECIPGFLKRLGRTVFGYWKWDYCNVVCKICGLQNLPFLESQKKIS